MASIIEKKGIISKRVDMVFKQHQMLRKVGITHADALTKSDFDKMKVALIRDMKATFDAIEIQMVKLMESKEDDKPFTF